MALAAFLVRGGIVIVVLAIVSFPSAAAIAIALTPLIDVLAFGTLTPWDLALFGMASVALLGLLGVAAAAGSWLDVALVREAADDEELDLTWSPRRVAARDALSIRLTAHFGTLFVAAYGAVRLIFATYAELMSPGDPGVDLIARVVGRAPDGVILPVLTWLLGETIGSVAVRRVAAGAGTRAALVAATRQVLRPRGLSTLMLTTTVLVLTAAPFLLGVQRAWENVRAAVIGNDPALAPMLLLMVAIWVLGLALLGAALAWRATAWTAELGALRTEPAKVVPERETAVTPA